MLVVFDLDDTLYHESDFVKSGRNAIMKYLSANGIDFDINGIWTPEIRTIYHEHMPEISLSDDARRALDLLSQHSVPLGIITDGRLTPQSNKIKALGIERYIGQDDILISEAIGADKTTPAPFTLMMQKHPGESDFIYIGDNPAKDFRQPNLLGWTTVMLIDSTNVNVHPQDLPDDPDCHPTTAISSLYTYISQLLKATKTTLTCLT